jgi:cytochrome b561
MSEDPHAMTAAHRPSEATGEAYDGRTILFHWLTAALVAVQWVGAHYIDAFPRGPLRVDARSTHIVIGVALVVILVARLSWRNGGGRRLAPVVHPVARSLSTATHRLLYVALAAVLLAGLANAWVRGDSLFNLVHLPSPAPGDKALRHQVETVHEWLANGILILAGAHAAAALLHPIVWKDTVLARMAPRRRQG